MINRADSNWPESETHELSAAEPTDIYSALSASRNGMGSVYAETVAGQWLPIDEATTSGFILRVKSVAGMWFIPQQWEVRSR